VIKRFFEIMRNEGVKTAIKKAVKFGPVIVKSKISKALFKINSKKYWDFRMALNWSGAGGSEQTRGFAESLFDNVSLETLDFDSVLDYGCALGDSAPVFRRLRKDLEIYLWDVSQVGLDKALKAHSNINVKRWDCSTKVDFVYCSNVIEHIENVDDFVHQLIAASKKWVCIQAPYNEFLPSGDRITPDKAHGEHIWTIDDEFIDRYLNLPVFDEIQKVVGLAPESWPGGQQVYFLGKLKVSEEQVKK